MARHRSAVRNVALAIVTIALLHACEARPPKDTFEPLPIEYVTDHLEIATSETSRSPCPTR